MTQKSPRRRLTAAQREEKLHRRKARQAEQAHFEKELRQTHHAEKLLVCLLAAMPILSFFMFADRVCGGVLSLLLILAQVIPLVILYRFRTLWKKQFILILCTYSASAVIIALSCTVQSAVFTPSYPMPWILIAWGVLLAAWLVLILRQSESHMKCITSSVLIALSLFFLTFFGAGRVNISFDRSTPQTVTADVLEVERIWSESSYTYWIKASFPLSDGSRTTRRFCVLRTDDYEQLSAQSEIMLLRHKGALGCEWYEIELPK